LKLWKKITISALLLALLLYFLPWSQMRGAIERLPLVVWVGVLAGYVAGHTCGVFKWRILVNSARAGLSRVDAALCYCAGLFANLFLPSIVGGDVLRIGLVARITRRPVAALWGGVMDRMTDVLALLVLMSIGGLTARQSLNGWFGNALLAATCLGIGAALLIVMFALGRKLTSWPRKLRRPLARALLGLRRLRRRPQDALITFALSLSVQGSFVLLNAWLGGAIGIDVSLSVWLLVWPMAKFAALVPVTLGGLAVREASLAALLLPFGVPPALSVACSLLWQAVLMVSGLLAGLVWLALHRSRKVDFRSSGGRVIVSGPEHA
jgi:uncharacterized membrane protein YbhN (UPF0104 family)